MPLSYAFPAPLSYDEFNNQFSVLFNNQPACKSTAPSGVQQ